MSNVARIQTEATESLREFLHIGKVDAVDMSDCVPSYGIMEGIEAAVGMCVCTYVLTAHTNVLWVQAMEDLIVGESLFWGV